MDRETIRRKLDELDDCGMCKRFNKTHQYLDDNVPASTCEGNRRAILAEFDRLQAENKELKDDRDYCQKEILSHMGHIDRLQDACNYWHEQYAKEMSRKNELQSTLDRICEPIKKWDKDNKTNFDYYASLPDAKDETCRRVAIYLDQKPLDSTRGKQEKVDPIWQCTYYGWDKPKLKQCPECRGAMHKRGPCDLCAEWNYGCVAELIQCPTCKGEGVVPND